MIEGECLHRVAPHLPIISGIPLKTSSVSGKAEAPLLLQEGNLCVQNFVAVLPLALLVNSIDPLPTPGRDLWRVASERDGLLMKNIVSLRKKTPMSIGVLKLRCRGGIQGIHVGGIGEKDHTHLSDEGSRGKKVMAAAAVLLRLHTPEVHQ